MKDIICMYVPENRHFLHTIKPNKKGQEIFMNIRIKTDSLKNAMGTIFLLAAAFFICSTFMSMRSVLADPIVPDNTNIAQSGRQSPRANTRTSNRTVSRSTATRTTAVRSTNGKKVASRGTVARSVSSRSPQRTTNTSSRNVSSRTQKTSLRNTNNRAVRARTSETPSRVSASSSVMPGTKGVRATSYSYLSSSLYSGTYSSIVDSSTGLISADAYSNCLSSYYTCMDEICTARSDTKGRCSCAGRANNFLSAEDQLDKANEELIKLSGQLALLISTKGKGDDLVYAFSLTDAEKVMNCVSYKDALEVAGSTKDAQGNTISKEKYMQEWCQAHMMYETNECSATTQPSYCSESGNNFGFDVKDIDGSSSDILAQLQAWADAKDLAKQYTMDDSNNLLTKYMVVADVVDGLSGINNDSDTANLDALANKWGYKLFEYAHNNVCGRVLDSCFNGIYEGCGTPGTITDSDGKTHTKCANGATSNCPFNYNSYISVDSSTGDVVLNERGSSSASVTATASCFGYTTTTSTTAGTRTTTSSSADPYATLRGPVADARRSIMQKYLLDANSACDVYGTALKKTAQNINYQKIAAEQALQQKRLEFRQEEESQVFADATSAVDNFNECISEIWDCYEEYGDEDDHKWTTARIKAYCAQVSQVPHCYETMICSPLQSPLVAVVDKEDKQQCTYTDDYETNTCRNVVSISEILYGTGATDTEVNDIAFPLISGNTYVSRAVREKCLREVVGKDSSTEDTLRGWKKPAQDDEN